MATTSRPTTRRERLRQELIAEVLATARRSLATGGPAAVSWRGIAREVGVNPATLYTYFASLDDLFTAVILDSFTRLAGAIGEAAQEAAAAAPLERVLVCARAYRSWAIEHPAEFNLIFTDRIPGYEAPVDGPTVAVQAEIFGPFLTALDDLASVGDKAGRTAGIDADADAAAIVADDRVGLWATMHGFVMLEINHHLPFVDDRDRLFDQTLRDRLTGQ
jgi:AcrR family transcriptional regulator